MLLKFEYETGSVPISRIIDAFAVNYNYQETIPNPVRMGMPQTIPNPDRIGMPLTIEDPLDPELTIPNPDLLTTPEFIPNPDLLTTPETIANPETKAQFAKRMLRNHIVDIVKSQDISVAQKTARDSITSIELT